MSGLRSRAETSRAEQTNITNNNANPQNEINNTPYIRNWGYLLSGGSPVCLSVSQSATLFVEHSSSMKGGQDLEKIKKHVMVPK